MKKTACFLLFFGIWSLALGLFPAGALPGDVNGDSQMDISDNILALKIMSQSPSDQSVNINTDINNDGRIGMAETFYILQGVTGQRVLPTVFALTTLSGKITLPTGVPVALEDLTVLNTAGETHPDVQGGFTVDTLDGGASLNTVLSPAGNVMLLGWLDSSHQSISPRTTAEVMLFFALGADRYPTDERDNIRWLLAISPEVAPLETAISTSLAANADAFAGESAAVTAALTGVIDAFSASETATQISSARKALSVSVEPAEEKSGITILMEGVNKIRLSNAYRRRLKVWIDQIAYVPQGGGAWVQSKLPLTEFEVDPVTGLKSVMGTINDWIAGQSAYTPVKSEPDTLSVMPRSAEKTAYEVIACGNGFFDGDIMTLPGDRLASYGATAVNFIFFDIIMPAIINIVAPQTKVPEILKKYNVADPDVSMFLKTIQSSPALLEKLSKGDIHGATTTIRSMMIDTYKKGILNDILKNMVTIRGETPANALRAGNIVDGFLGSMKVMNAALTAADIKAIETHGYLSNKMETWRIEVTHPKVVLTPEKAIILPEGTQEFLATLPEAAGEGAPSLVYHWKSSSDHGTITDGIHTGKEFDSSRDKVTYTGVSIGTDSVEMEAFDAQGQNRVSIGTGSSTVEVASVRVSINKTLVDVAQGKIVMLKGVVEPAPTADQEIWYSWSSACTFGIFNGGNPFSDKSDQLIYMANASMEGEDIVTLTVYRVVGGWQTGIRTALGQAQARIRVWTSPKKAPMALYTYGPQIVYHSYQAPGMNKPQTRWLIYGYANSWPTPEGMHHSGTPIVPTTINMNLPLYSRYYDDSYKMGLDLKKDLGIPDGVNFDIRMVVKSIGTNPDPYSLKDAIYEANKYLNSMRANWESIPKPYNIDCTP
ncbi:MAG: hypothetical protein ABIJ31_05975 [Pseudomonadota bacterium]